MDIHTLRKVRDFVGLAEQKEYGVECIIDLQRHIERKENDNLDDHCRRRNPDPWRAKMKTAVEGVISPDHLDWMEDDESLADLAYINRALDEISNRFMRLVFNDFALD